MKYKVQVIVSTTFEVIVEAENEREAEEKAEYYEYFEMREIDETIEFTALENV